jgi:hypothetical protein
MRSANVLLAVCLFAVAAPVSLAADPAVTVYNQNFAVIRETIHLDLTKGINQVTFAGMTMHLEPDSVMLRDPSGKRDLQILEQNYRADPISQGLLLSVNEGKTIPFLVQRGETQETIQGKIIRSGYTPHSVASRRYGGQYYQQQMAYSQGPGAEPVVELPGGMIRFGLPGTPFFPALGDDTVLKPTLSWVIDSNQAGPLEAELGYVTGGMSWEASYNLVAPKDSEKLDMVGWVTIDNQTGKTFENAHIKLMAGDISKIVQRAPEVRISGDFYAGGALLARGPAVTEKTFDEYHLYTVERPATLHDRETKQVEFLRADGVKSDRFYVYDGVQINEERYLGWDSQQIMQAPEYGTQSHRRIWVMREIHNTKGNHLGIPLPAGRTRFYQRDDDGQLEFTGENVIVHTPRDENLRIYTGDAFDLVGERKRMNFKCEYDHKMADESFEIALRNRKKEPVEIRVVEHLYRGVNWEIVEPSDPFKKTDSKTIEFRVQVKPDEEKKITYTAHYTW